MLAFLIASALAGPAEKMDRLVAKEDCAKALEVGAAALEKEPDAPEIRARMARADHVLVSEEDSVEAYTRWLRAWPGSVLVPQVQAQLAAATWRELESSQDSAALQAFQRSFPEHPLTADARSRAQRLAWEAAREEDEVEAYNAFRVAWPESAFALAALEHEAALVYTEVRNQDSLEAYLAFLKAYPEAPQAEDARKRSEDLAWERARKLDSVEGWRDYRENYPGTERARRAFDKELALAWQAAEGTHTPASYRAFQQAYPDSELALEAERREWDVYHFSRAPYPGELHPSVTRVHRQPDGRYRLWVDVRDADGELVGGVGQEHFQVYDAGFRATEVEVAGMEQDRPVDVVFVLDVTGSMSEEIEGVKEGILRFADLMALRSRDARYGLVSFGDEIRAVHPLTGSVSSFRSWVSAQRADGGGDDPENPLDALAKASGFSFRPEAQVIFVLVTDARGHQRDRVSRRSYEEVASTLAGQGIGVYTVGPDDAGNRRLVQSTAGEHYPLDKRRFAQTMEAIAQKVSKQYRITYRRPELAPAVVDQLAVVLRVRQPYSLVASDETPLSALALAGGLAWRARSSGGLDCSRDGGLSWLACGTGLPGDAVDELLPGAALLAMVDERLFRSGDGGARFEALGFEEVRLVAVGERTWLVLGDRLVWLDEEGLPHDATLSRGDWTALYADGSQVWAVLADGTLWHSADGLRFEASEPGWGSITGLARHPSRAGLLFAFGPSGLYRSLDDGGSWRKVLENPVQALVLDPSVRQLHLAVGPEGVFASEDLGATWALHSSSGPSLAAVDESGRVLLGGETGLFSLSPVTNREFVVSSVFFSSGSAVLRKALLPHLDDAARWLRLHPEVRLRVEGHTDSVGDAAQNKALSEARARWVVEYLAGQGVPAERLTAVGYGEERPLFDNGSADGRARNRRVELVFLAPPQGLPAMEGMR